VGRQGAEVERRGEEVGRQGAEVERRGEEVGRSSIVVIINDS